MDHESAEAITGALWGISEALKQVASALGWCALWLFCIAIGSCAQVTDKPEEDKTQQVQGE